MQKNYAIYEEALAEELIPAMGCTEPIAIAYCAAVCREQLGAEPEQIEIWVSRNIIKNVKSVVVPNTDHMKGIEVACAAGIVAAHSERQLEVLAYITAEEKVALKELAESGKIKIHVSEEPDIFYIRVFLAANGQNAEVTIRTDHTNVTSIKKNGATILSKPIVPEEEEAKSLWRIEDVLDAARHMPLDNVKHLLERQIEYNMAISKEGLDHDYGASIGKILLRRDPDSLRTRARASAAAGSDARMNGCELPVVITSGSGNQGITASVPVVVYAHALAASEEKLLRAVLLSDLITIYLKQGIGKLSAYCGAISAGCGSGAGIAYLHDCTDEQIEHAVENALAINSGIICDGAKSSCAAKIAMAVEGGLLGFDMAMAEHNFEGGDGIVQETADETIAAVGKIASQGMVETDKEIIDVMLGL
ncbi:serine dehydratase subunit alpha family protein [uncultured Phascolarctobacterium sp.]|jgi:L-cysteine desulfidase|uniref:L-cysteine desulfidase family protein n=1 Tax=uncultured Phascolarctobacterium sp. TaxID=512296 RepID=UPI0025FDD620|nr:L-serine ammonia-lyase, iron-sulfur-dependent, subunit alpha [uncultured Phascolarctobacterium sp.]